MNSLGSIQSINNKIITTVVSTVVTVLNNGFQTPMVATNTFTNPYDFNSGNASTPFSYNNWLFTCNYVSGSTVGIYQEDGTTPSGLSQLSTTYPQCLQLAFSICNASLTISQSVYFPTSGTYQLSYYLAPFVGYYGSSLTISSAIGSQSSSAFTLNPTSGWVNYTNNFTISSSGYQTLAFVFHCSDSSNTYALFFTGITITYLHA